MHLKAGGQIVVPSADQRELWRKALSAAWPKMVQEVGGEAANFYKEMETGRAACEKKS